MSINSTAVKTLLVVGAATATLGIVVALRRRLQGDAIDNIRISQLWLYPVKSCSGSPQCQLRLTAAGAAYDREWAIFRRRDNKFVSQREAPSLKLVCATIVEKYLEGSPVVTLRLCVVRNAQTLEEDVSVPPLEIPVAHRDTLDHSATIPVSIWDIKGGVIDEGPEAAAWLSEVVGDDVFLGRMVVPRNPADNEKYASVIPSTGRAIALQDFSPLHVCSEEGFSYVEQHDPIRTAASTGGTIDATRFRPNVVVKGVRFPDEDTWSSFSMGSILFKTVKRTTRCSIPTIDEYGQRRPDYFPTSFLQKERCEISKDASGSKKGKPVFGISAFIDDSSCGRAKNSLVIRVGDSLHVLKRMESCVGTLQ